MSRALATAIALVLTVLPAAAQCVGKNMLQAMPEDERAAITAAAQAVPYPSGNFWRATRGDEVVHIVGTYHFDDPRHAPTLAAVRPLIDTAATVLVEAGPDEEKALMDRLSRDPGVMFLVDGPTLPERLPEDDWQMLAAAMSARGVPPFMAAKFQPWYISLLLAIPTCQMAEAVDAKGLDGAIIDAATAAGVPVRALEPYDTIFRIFGAMTEDEQLAMIRSSLALEDRGDDLAVTLADSYFAGESREIWELMRHQSLTLPGFTAEQIDAEFAKMEEAMMASRNRAWIPVIEAAVEGGPVFAAFGALHLSGDDGVLSLLEREGFALERLPI